MKVIKYHRQERGATNASNFILGLSSIGVLQIATELVVYHVFQYDDPLIGAVIQRHIAVYRAHFPAESALDNRFANWFLHSNKS